MNTNTRCEIIETLLLWSVFFLPGYLFATSQSDISFFDSWFYSMQYIATAIPEFLLLVFLIARKNQLHEYGFIRFSRRDPFDTIVIFLLLWMTVYIAGSIISLLPSELINPVSYTISERKIIPLLFIASLITGYLEEGFFRCYMFRQLRSTGIEKPVAIAAVSVLFGLGHLYQGIGGFLITTAMGVVFQLYYVKIRASIHPIALAHCLYNFSALLLATL